MADDVISLKINLEANTANMTLQELEDHFEAMKTKLKGIGRGDAEFEKLSRAMAKTTAEIKNIEIGFEGLDRTQIASELGAVAGGISAITASLILMGGENETMREMGQSIQAALAITMGVKGAIEAATAANKLYTNSERAKTIQTNISAAATKAKLAVENAQFKAISSSNKATKAGIVIQKLWNFVVSMNPIALIVIGIGLAVAAMIYFSDTVIKVIKIALKPFQFWIDIVIDGLQAMGIMASDEANAIQKAGEKKIESYKKQAKELKKLQAAHEELSKKVIKDLDYEVALLKAKGEDTTAIEFEVLREKNKIAKKSYELAWKSYKAEKALIDNKRKYGQEVTQEEIKRINEISAAVETAAEAFKDSGRAKTLFNETNNAKNRAAEEAAAKDSSSRRKSRRDKAAADESKRLIEEAKALAEFNEEQARIRIQLIQDEGERKRAEIEYNSQLELEALEKKGALTFDAEMLIAQTKSKALADLQKEEDDKKEAIRLSKVKFENELALKQLEAEKLLRDTKLQNDKNEEEIRRLAVEDEFQNKLKTLEEQGLLTTELEIELLYSQEQALADIKEEFREKERQANIETAQITMDLAASTLSEISGINSAFADRDVKAEEDRFNNLRATKQLTEKQLAAEELKTSQIKDAIRKKQFENEKKMQLATAAMNGAQALVSILAQYPKFDGGFAMVAALAGSVITTAASIAKIKSTTFSSTPSAALPTLQSGDSSGAGSGGGGAQITPVTNTSTILGNQQVYVTETDITSTQNNVSVIEESATF
jgi:hypothetical protein